MNADQQKKVDCVGHMMFSLMFILCTFSALLWVTSQYISHIFLPTGLQICLVNEKFKGKSREKGRSQYISSFLILSGGISKQVPFLCCSSTCQGARHFIFQICEEKLLPSSQFQPDILSFWVSVTSHSTVVPQYLQEIGSRTLLGYQNPRMIKSLK